MASKKVNTYGRPEWLNQLMRLVSKWKKNGKKSLINLEEIERIAKEAPQFTPDFQDKKLFPNIEIELNIKNIKI